MISFFFYILKKIRLYLEFLHVIIASYQGKNNLKKILKSKNKEFLYVFDTSVSSLAYGDFFISSFFLRYISIHKRVRFILINDSIRQDVKKRLSKEDLLKRIKEFKYIVKFICKNNCQIEELNFKNFINNYRTKNNIFLKKLILKRKAIYKINFNIINKLYPKLSNFEKKRLLLSKKDFLYFKKPKKKFDNFISVGVRMNYPNEDFRNHTKNSIIKFIEYIKSKKNSKNKKILIVSDNKSLINLKKIFKSQKNIFFSKDYTKSFLQDGYYILSSNFYYQYYGTGISVFAEFSKLKFEIFTDLKRGFATKNVLRSDQMYSGNKKNSWQTKHQTFFDID